ncbi:MAG: hypothetical protein RIT28_4671 [Pseudomonadota bacterium]
MNPVFLFIVFAAFIVAALSGTMEATSKGAFDGAKAAVDLALGLVGYMALFLGLMKVAEEGGLLRILSRAIRPVMVRLFPDVPPDHPAMGAMIMNIAANMIGLTNAATPLGIKAMQELSRLNRRPGVATDAMVLFLAINTSGLSILPTGVMGVRAAAGSVDPFGIMAPTLFATTMATVTAIIATKFYQRLRRFSLDNEPIAEGEAQAAAEESAQVQALMADSQEPVSDRAVLILRLVFVSALAVLVLPALAAAVGPALGLSAEESASLRAFSTTSGQWVVPSLFVLMLGFGWAKGVKVYETFIRGAKEGFTTALTIIPYLVAILAVVGMFRGSGAMTALTSWFGVVTAPLGMPGEVLPMALIRPLSGSGAFALMGELINTHGPDSYIGNLASVLQGSTDTTFYILAVYFGAVGISRTRHAVLAGVTADLAGFMAATAVCAAIYGHLR